MGVLIPFVRGHGTETVSVVMATRNGARFVQEQLVSLTNQTRRPDEVIIVDDASTDGTGAILKEFRDTSPLNVSLTLRGHHLGTSATFEEAILGATGSILLICDQDDRWMPDKIEVMVRALEDEPDALLAFSDSRLIDSNGRCIERSRWKIAGFSPRHWSAMSKDSFGQMMCRQIVSGCTSAVRSSLVPAILPFPTGLHSSLADMIYDRWISLIAAAAARVVVVPDRLVDYRIHPDQQIGIPALPVRRLAPRAVLHMGQFVASRAEVELRNDYHLRHLEEIDRRLDDAGLATAESSRHLALAEAHLHRRGALATARSRRARLVLDELRSDDGYRRFSLGVATAVADLVR
jgi:glycosyltransferase involved in cell wall biosynthesis